MSAALRLAGCALALMLGGCGPQHGAGETQVVARVNHKDISIHELNLMLQRQPGLAAADVEAASRAVLDGLIDQEVSAQRAVLAKLDRDPQVILSLELLRRDVLARAYVERLAQVTVPPTASEVQRFYDERPVLFKSRRVYTFHEINIEAAPGALAQLEPGLRSARSLQAMLDRLKASPARYAALTATRAAEDLPLPIVDRMAALSDGDSLLVPEAGRLKVILLVSTLAAPLSLQNAERAITQYLQNERRHQAVAAELKGLREAAQVEYVGRFAIPASAPRNERVVRSD